MRFWMGIAFFCTVVEKLRIVLLRYGRIHRASLRICARQEIAKVKRIRQNLEAVVFAFIHLCTCLVKGFSYRSDFDFALADIAALRVQAKREDTRNKQQHCGQPSRAAILFVLRSAKSLPLSDPKNPKHQNCPVDIFPYSVLIGQQETWYETQKPRPHFRHILSRKIFLAHTHKNQTHEQQKWNQNFSSCIQKSVQHKRNDWKEARCQNSHSRKPHPAFTQRAEERVQTDQRQAHSVWRIKQAVEFRIYERHFAACKASRILARR